MREVILAGLNVVSDGLFMDNAYIHMRNGKIVAVGKNDNTSFPAHVPIRTYDKDTTALPGFIDVHIHGGYGVDVMDANEDVFTTLGEKLPTEGTTAYLATTITSSKDRTVQALQQCAQSVKKLGSAELLGVHLEGPFIHPDKRGAQPLEHIEPANVEMFAEFQRAADGTIRIVTLAPEIEGANKLLQKCIDERVITSIGHTTVEYETLEQLVQDEPMHVTHLYNAMPGLHHRRPVSSGQHLRSLH
ncbi:amidohydrolase family protein [Geomicrobium sp. JCM 19039]|uniref:amidohydrolase family protein n=1 Tax=Geomicrobium sp. JCM 19039 TaxID=1460636 RepID=UPI00045F12E9|nr:amidohydrolase family protein [Geomicrobium sp. JCM 19039]GAK14274.1 N-acetylglucosamine-6-phosphate deacetylase [Geomicrobium sp. JCM 19039]